MPHHYVGTHLHYTHLDLLYTVHMYSVNTSACSYYIIVRSNFSFAQTADRFRKHDVFCNTIVYIERSIMTNKAHVLHHLIDPAGTGILAQ